MFKNKEAIAVHQVRKPPPFLSLSHFPDESPDDLSRQARDEQRRKPLIKEGVSWKQDPWGVQARRVSSVRPSGEAATALKAPFSAWVVLKKCEAGNPRQVWYHGGEPPLVPADKQQQEQQQQQQQEQQKQPSNGSVPGRLWTVDEQGRRWCMGESSW